MILKEKKRSSSDHDLHDGFAATSRRRSARTTLSNRRPAEDALRGIMRRLLRDIAEGRVPGDTTTLAGSSVLEALEVHYLEKEN